MSEVPLQEGSMLPFSVLTHPRRHHSFSSARCFGPHHIQVYHVAEEPIGDTPVKINF